MADILIENFKNNILSLEKYFPEIAEKFKNYIPTSSIDFFCSPTGFPNIKFTDVRNNFYQDKSPILFSKFLKSIVKTNKLEQYVNIDCPLAFSEFAVQNIINERVVSLLTKNEYDVHGQIYFKYINRIHEILSSFIFDSAFERIQDTSFIPLFVSNGIGLGYHLEELCSKINIRNLVIIEPDSDVFFASLHTFDWSSLIQKMFKDNKTITFILDNDPEIIGRKFYLFFLEQGLFNMGGLSVYNLYNDELTGLITQKLKDFYLALSSAYGYIDDRAFGISHTWYEIKNKRNFVLTTPISSNYKNYPVFIIGSGPSLDSDLPFIKKYQDKAIIIACGTALDTLYHAGIMPDFYANTERTPQVKQALDVIPDKDFLDRIILLTSNVCHPYVIDTFKKTAIFGKWDENFVDYLIKNLDKNTEFDNIQSIKYMNPLVGNMGISSAITLGFNKIFLFGIDNGKEINTSNMHSKFTSVYANSGASDKGGNYEIQSLVPGNFGGQCETNQIFIKSIMTIESALLEGKDDPDFECINCSNGAFINNCTAKHSYDLEKQFSEKEIINKKEFSNYFLTNKTKNFEITEEQFRNTIHPEIMNKIYDNIIDLINHCKKTKEGYFKLCQDINEFLKNIRENLSTFYSRTAESSLNNMLVELIAVLFSENKQKSKEAAEEILYVIKDFLIESKELFAKLPDYCLGDHKKHYPDGKVGRDMPHCKATAFPPLLNIIGKVYDDPVKKFVKKYE